MIILIKTIILNYFLIILYNMAKKLEYVNKYIHFVKINNSTIKFYNKLQLNIHNKRISKLNLRINHS